MGDQSLHVGKLVLLHVVVNVEVHENLVAGQFACFLDHLRNYGDLPGV